MARRRARKNYYKNSRIRRRERTIRRCVVFVKVVFLLAGFAGTSLVFILAHDALTQSSCFEARSIAVQGNHRLSKEAILRQGNIKLHDNIFGINLKILRHRLLSNPWIAAAEVERELPDTIHILVREHVPVAAVELERLYYLSEDGELFKPVEPSDQTKGPVVSGLRFSDIDPNNPRCSPVFRAIMEVIHLSRLHGSILPPRVIRNIHADAEMGLTLSIFENGLVIKLGFGGYESKFNRLRDLITQLRRWEEPSDVAFIDLNDLDRVVVRPSGGVSFMQACYRKET